MKYFAAIVAISIAPALFVQPSFAQTDPHAGLQLNTIQPPSAPADPNKVVIAFGNQKITASEYEDIVASLPAQYQAAARGAGKRQFAEQLVQLRLLAAEAQKDKLDREPKVQRQLEFNRDNLLASVAFQRLQDNVKISDADLQAYYDAHKSDYEEVSARHILIRVKGAPMQQPAGKPELTDEEALAKAKAIRARLVAGENFAKVAQAESDDTGSAAKGGDLGPFKKGMMVPPFEQAAFAAKIGEVSEPVKSPFGYHIIVVYAHSTTPLSVAKADIEKKVKPELARAELQNMEKGANVTIDDSFFGPAPAPHPPISTTPPGAGAAR